LDTYRPRASQIDYLWTPVSILLEPRALEAVEGIADTLSTADDALVLIVAKGAFITYTDQCRRTNVGVADGAFAIAFVAEPTNSNTGLFAAHDKIRMMARHGERLDVEDDGKKG